MINLDNLDTFPYVEAMAACMQDPIYHGEGDVWTHTKMVMDGLIERNDRLTALYHDVAKPETRTVVYSTQQGREVISHPHHARKGAAIAWYDLWLAGESLQTRLAVYWLCRWHQKVFHLWTERDMTRAALEFASISSWGKLLDFARADNAGRICATSGQTRDDLDLLENWLHENLTVWEQDHDRIFYFEKAGRSPLYHSQPPQGSRVIVLSGLPGVGKDSHIRTRLADLSVVSLDAIREELDVDPTDNQGRVVQAAFEQARILLRDKRPFVWNAQCGTRLIRDKIIGLCRAYDAHVTIHALDRPLSMILEQNKTRRQPVPEAVILAAAKKWEPPTLVEAHQIEWM